MPSLRTASFTALARSLQLPPSVARRPLPPRSLRSPYRTKMAATPNSASPDRGQEEHGSAESRPPVRVNKVQQLVHGDSAGTNAGRL